MIFLTFQNAILPAGFRQRDQTKKSATGPFDRFALMDFLEKQAMEHKDREDLVPFTGEKRGTTNTGFILTTLLISYIWKAFVNKCVLKYSTKGRFATYSSLFWTFYRIWKDSLIIVLYIIF